MVPVTVVLVMVFAGCAKNELPTPTNPKYIGTQCIRYNKSAENGGVKMQRC